MLLLPAADMPKLLSSFFQSPLNQSPLHHWSPAPSHCCSQHPAPTPSLSAGSQPFLPHISWPSTLPAPNSGLFMLLLSTPSTATQKGLCRSEVLLSYSLSKIWMLILISTNSSRQAVIVPPPGHLGPERPDVTDEWNELANTSGRQAALIKIGHQSINWPCIKFLGAASQLLDVITACHLPSLYLTAIICRLHTEKSFREGSGRQ